MDWQQFGTLIIGAIMAWQWWDSKREKTNKPDLSDPDYDDILGAQLESIQSRFEAMRCTYWAFTNGTMTADGYSMKNLSCMVERNREGVDSIIRELQNIPCANFKRNLNALRESDSLIVTHEHNTTDSLGRFHQYYGANTNIYVKVFNGNKWTGIIGLNFEDIGLDFDPQSLAWLSFQSATIGNELKRLKR